MRGARAADPNRLRSAAYPRRPQVWSATRLPTTKQGDERLYLLWPAQRRCAIERIRFTSSGGTELSRSSKSSPRSFRDTARWLSASGRWRPRRGLTLRGDRNFLHAVATDSSDRFPKTGRETRKPVVAAEAELGFAGGCRARNSRLGPFHYGDVPPACAQDRDGNETTATWLPAGCGGALPDRERATLGRQCLPSSPAAARAGGHFGRDRTTRASIQESCP